MRTVPSTVRLDDRFDSWELHLRATHKSARTIQSYLESARQLVAFLTDRGMPAEADKITREYVEAFIVDVLEHRKAATAAVRFRSLQQLFRWLEEEGEIPDSPMRKMKVPKVVEEPVDVFTDDEVRALLAACATRSFDDRRDSAIIRFFDGTGVRLAELAGISLGDFDLRAGTVRVLGKGGKARVVAMDDKTAEAVDRYLRVRRNHPKASEPWLWLGSKGRFTESGISQMLKRRGRQAEVANVHAHRFRHTFSHHWRVQGGSEDGLMSANGWTTRTMLGRYAASTAAVRAQAEARRLNLGGRL